MHTIMSIEGYVGQVTFLLLSRHHNRKQTVMFRSQSACSTQVNMAIKTLILQVTFLF